MHCSTLYPRSLPPAHSGNKLLVSLPGFTSKHPSFILGQGSCSLALTWQEACPLTPGSFPFHIYIHIFRFWTSPEYSPRLSASRPRHHSECPTIPPPLLWVGAEVCFPCFNPLLLWSNFPCNSQGCSTQGRSSAPLSENFIAQEVKGPT